MKKIKYFLIIIMMFSTLTAFINYYKDYKVINAIDPKTLDPVYMTNDREFRIYISLFEGLLSYHPETSYGIPGIAKTWDVSDDGLKYTFNLRESYWNDGVEIEAQTIADSWLRILNPKLKSKNANMLTSLVKGAKEYYEGNSNSNSVMIKAINKNTFQVELIKPAPYFLDMLPHYSFAVMPMHVIKKHGKKWTEISNLVSNGPFHMKEYIPEKRIVLKKNKNYRDSDKIKITSLSFLPIKASNKSFSRFINGGYDWMVYVPTYRQDEIEDLKEFRNSMLMGNNYILFNPRKAVLEKIKFRKALSLAINRNQLCRDLFLSKGFPAQKLVPELTLYKKQSKIKYSKRKAKELLKEAGHENGKNVFKIVLTFKSNDTNLKLVDILKKYWEKSLGVEIIYNGVDEKKYDEVYNNGNFDMILVNNKSNYADPYVFFEPFISNDHKNNIKFSNKQFDKLIYDSQKIIDRKKRYSIYEKAEKIIINDEQIIIPLYFDKSISLINENTSRGWKTNVLDIHPLQYMGR